MRLKEHFRKNVVPTLQKELRLKNPLATAKIEKVIVHVSIGTYLAGGKDYKPVVENVAAITGQRPVVDRARKAISNFKLRIGMPIGVTVTLRGKRMYDFLDKLIHVVLPRIRDFQGMSKRNFDGKGNYNFGIKEYTVFPDISAEDINKVHGLQITISTTASNNETGYLLLKQLGFPFKKET